MALKEIVKWLKEAHLLVTLIGIVAVIAGLYGIVFIIEFKILSDVIFLIGLFLVWLGDYLGKPKQQEPAGKRDMPNEINKGVQFINDVFWGPDKK